jgi:hypothetical protein
MHNKENAVRNERRESGGVFSSLLEHPQPETECSMEALVVSLRQDNHRLRTKCNQHIKRLQSYREGGQQVLNFTSKFGSLGTGIRAWLAAVAGFTGKELSNEEYEKVIASTLILLCQFDGLGATESDTRIYTPASKEVNILYENILKKMGIEATSTLDGHVSSIKAANSQGTA